MHSWPGSLDIDSAEKLPHNLFQYECPVNSESSKMREGRHFSTCFRGEAKVSHLQFRKFRGSGSRFDFARRFEELVLVVIVVRGLARQGDTFQFGAARPHAAGGASVV